jgi:hypothetical protein
MAVFWVHPLFTLPVIWENFGMGDEAPQRRRPLEAVEPFGKLNVPRSCFCFFDETQARLFKVIARAAGNGCA